MRSSYIGTEVTGIASDREALRKEGFCSNGHNGNVRYQDGIPNWLQWAAYKILKDDQLIKIAEKKFLKTLKPKDIAYLWCGTSLELFQKVKSLECVVITEFINTQLQTSKRILDQEYNALNIPVNHGISEERVSRELKILDLVDIFFSPSNLVTTSLTDAGVNKGNIIQSSYGLRESDILSQNSITQKEGEKFCAIFVGSIGLRKGIHLLLKAWEKSGVDGELILIGRIEDEVAGIVSTYLKNPNIKHIGFVRDLTQYYQKADVFLLPSLEEGSPLVTYLALGASLPLIVSPMGAGGVVTDGKEGFVIDPHLTDMWAKAIKKLATDGKKRKEMASRSRKLADEYLWEKVGASRGKRLLKYLAKYCGESEDSRFNQ